MIDLAWINNIFSDEVCYVGIANPSGAVALDEKRFIVADDELNQLLVFDRNVPDKAEQIISLSKVFPDEISDGEDMEIDMESTAEIEGTYFWLGSHSTSKKGEDRPARRRLLAVTIKPSIKSEFEVKPAGEIYTRLIDDLNQDARFKKYELSKAQTISPKAIGGLSIEGLAATPEKTLLIGFRNPLIGGEIKKDRLKKANALLVELLNPFEIIHGVNAQFADPIELNLDGFGIRDITWRKKQKYLIVAGPYHDNAATDGHPREELRLYQWSKKSNDIKLFKSISLDSLNVEVAFFTPDNKDDAILLSDDGKTGTGKSFRSRTVNLE